MVNGPLQTPPGSHLCLRHWLWGGRHFSTRPGAALSHVGSLAIWKIEMLVPSFGYKIKIKDTVDSIILKLFPFDAFGKFCWTCDAPAIRI